MFEIKYNKHGEAIKQPEPDFSNVNITYDKDGMPLKQEQQMQAVQEEVPDNSREEAQDIQEIAEPALQKVESTTEDYKKPGPQESFREMRERLARAERERDEAYRMAKDVYEKSQKMAQQPLQQQSEEEDFSMSPDDIVEGKHLSKLEKKYQKKYQQLEQQMRDYQVQQQQATIESQLRMQYPDFEKVVSKENIDMLREMDPLEYESIHYNPNLYNKAILAYRKIKEKGIYKEDIFQQERALAQRNASKPKPVNTIAPQQGETPLSQANAFANGLTKDLQAQLRKEMEDARKRM